MTENYCLEFNDIARQEVTNLGYEENDARRYMNRLHRDNIAQIIVLESLSRASGSRNTGRSSLCVVNTHIYSNQMKADVKLWQSIKLIHEIQQFVTTRPDLALIICGDFNSEPSSAVYDFIMNGHLLAENHPEEFINDSTVRILPDAHDIVHDMSLASAMQTALGQEPHFTNYTSKFKGTLDYIFYSPSRLRILAITSPPDEYDVRAVAGDGLPCTCYPSDHVLLSCDVAMIQSGNGSLFHSNNGNEMSPSQPSLPAPHMQQQQQQQNNSNKSGGRGRGNK
jgi:CCR4-NOT transcription complex subunit 6